MSFKTKVIQIQHLQSLELSLVQCFSTYNLKLFKCCSINKRGQVIDCLIIIIHIALFVLVGDFPQDAVWALLLPRFGTRAAQVWSFGLEHPI